jgi:hypothetical protein
MARQRLCRAVQLCRALHSLCRATFFAVRLHPLSCDPLCSALPLQHALPCDVALHTAKTFSRQCHFLFAMRVIIAVRFPSALPCDFSLPCVVLPLCRAFFVSSHGKQFFAVREHTATDCCTAAAVFPVVLRPEKDVANLSKFECITALIL